jgi:hypothetical protein
VNIGIFNFGDVGSPHLETQLEIMEEHLARGDQVYFFVCNSDLPCCARNPEHDILECVTCVSRRRTGERLVSGPFKKLSLVRLTEGDHRSLATLQTEWDEAAALEAYRIGNYDIGLAVVSTVISLTSDIYFDPKRNRKLVGELLRACAVAYYSAVNWIRELGLHAVYVQNGRGDCHRAVLRACELARAEYRVHERGHSMNSFGLWVNGTPHSIPFTTRLIRDFWDRGDPNERAEKGRAFYENKVKGLDYGWDSFVTSQRQDALPENWDPAARNIALFTTAEDEFVGLGEEWVNRIYGDSPCALREIARGLAGRGLNARLYARVHPRLKGVNNRLAATLRDLQEPGLTVIPPESPISTYALMRATEKAVSFGSTTGIEAVYWGKPSIIAGRAFFEELGGTYNAASHAEVLDLLCADLQPKPIEPALMYGYFYSSFGTPLRHYRAKSYTQGSFKGLDLSVAATFGRGLADLVGRVRGARRFARLLGAAHRWVLHRRLRTG